MADFEKTATSLYDSLGRGSGSDVKRITLALRQAHNAALEEAAKVADRVECLRTDSNDPVEAVNHTLKYIIAPEIRALKLPENGGQ